MADDLPSIPERLVDGLIRLLDVNRISESIFRGERRPGGVGRVFGGQVIGQALAAAMQTVHDDKLVHSLHAYFMRGGDEDHPIEYHVESDFDGKSFANRRVVAVQHDKPILNLVASFQTPEEGLSHQAQMPDVPPPDQLEDQVEYLKRHRDRLSESKFAFHTRPNPFEIRPVGEPIILRSEASDPAQSIWFRTRAAINGGQHRHRAILAFATDYALLATALLPHRLQLNSRKIQGASLDHALWFHDDVKVDDWLLYTTDSPWAGHARGFNRGMIFDLNGTLVASSAQEGLIRIRE